MYTRDIDSRKKKSIIDHMFINKEFRKEVLDISVKRGPENLITFCWSLKLE